MFSNIKANKKQIITQDSFRSSRFNLMNQDEVKFNMKADYNDNINSKLAINFNQIVELLTQRKSLLLRKMDKIYDDTEHRMQAIFKGRLSDLRNEAKLLRDQNIITLIENSDKVSNTKSLLKKIIEQHNFSQFQVMQKTKGKRYFDKLKQTQNDFTNRNKKFMILSEELQKLNQKQRYMFQEIQNLQNQMIVILRRKQNDYLRKAENIQEEIQRKKNILKENKFSKDKKKKEMETILVNIVDIINSHQNFTLERSADLENLYGGSQNVEDFQRFIKQFQAIIESKHQDRKQKDDKKQKAVQQLIKISNGYEAYINELNKQRQNEVMLFENISEGFKNIIKTALIEKVYFQQMSHDRNKLNEILKKCKSYKSLLNEFQGERVKLNKELSKINHHKNNFNPRLKALTSEDIRRQELKRQLSPLLVELNELQKFERRNKEYQHSTNNYLLRKQAIQRDMDELAQKGNLAEYKIRLKELQRFEKEFQSNKEAISSNQYERRETRLASQAQTLNLKYADLINPIIIQDENMTYFTFLTKLSKRLSII